MENAVVCEVCSFYAGWPFEDGSQEVGMCSIIGPHL